MEMRLQKIAEEVAWGFLGTPYMWGGDDPMAGFDCSGFVIEILKSVGILSHRVDYTAEELFRLFEKYQLKEDRVMRGCLVFWRTSGNQKIHHVEFCLSSTLSIGASSGGSGTRTVQDAIDENAYIKVRPFKPRGGNIFVDPFLSLKEVGI